MSLYLSIENVTVKKHNRVILKDFNLSVEQGSITAIMGPSGIGKTTTISLVNGLCKPCSGRVMIQGVDINKLSRRQLYEKRINIGYMFQHGALFNHLSVFDNVAFPLLENTQLPAVMIRDLVLLRLEAVGLRGAIDLMPEQLSGGMARRVALARATILDPELMLYDEPFTGQDPISTGVLTDLVLQMKKNLNLTSVVVSHDVAAVAKIADVVHIIADGRVIASGSVKEIFSSKVAAVQQFINGLSGDSVQFHMPTQFSLAQELLHG